MTIFLHNQTGGTCRVLDEEPPPFGEGSMFYVVWDDPEHTIGAFTEAEFDEQFSIAKSPTGPYMLPEPCSGFNKSDALTDPGDPSSGPWCGDCGWSEKEHAKALKQRAKAAIKKVRLWGPGPHPHLTDEEALDAICYALSADEWSVSFLEDIAAIVHQTGRKDIKGAKWDSH